MKYSEFLGYFQWTDLSKMAGYLAGKLLEWEDSNSDHTAGLSDCSLSGWETGSDGLYLNISAGFDTRLPPQRLSSPVAVLLLLRISLKMILYLEK